MKTIIIFNSTHPFFSSTSFSLIPCCFLWDLISPLLWSALYSVFLLLTSCFTLVVICLLCLVFTSLCCFNQFQLCLVTLLCPLSSITWPQFFVASYCVPAVSARETVHPCVCVTLTKYIILVFVTCVGVWGTCVILLDFGPYLPVSGFIISLFRSLHSSCSTPYDKFTFWAGSRLVELYLRNINSHTYADRLLLLFLLAQQKTQVALSLKNTAHFLKV